MSRYIDVELFENNLPFLNDDEYDPYVLIFNSGVTACQKFIDELPTADVHEIKHGKWIKHHKRINLASGNTAEWDNYYCSECDTPQLSTSKCCPECGAIMDKE